MGMRDELYSRWMKAMEGVSFPVSSVDQVFAGLPKGADGNISVGGIVVCNTGDLFNRFLNPADFPIESAESLVNMILDRAGI